MDVQLAFTLATATVSLCTTVVVCVTSFWNLSGARLTREAAERAEERASESLHKSEQNARTLTTVATATQLNGRLTEYKRLVQQEANARILAAEARAGQEFMRGMEAQRASEPVATAAAVADLKQLVVETGQITEPVATAAAVAELKELVVEASKAASDAATDKPPGDKK